MPMRGGDVLTLSYLGRVHEFRGDLTAFNNKIRTISAGQGTRRPWYSRRPAAAYSHRRHVLVTSDHGFIEC